MIAVIGAGAMGSVIAEELSRANEVAVIDTSRESLSRVNVESKFLGSPLDFPGIGDIDLAVTALPAEQARGIVESLLRMGRNVVDISFTDYDPFELKETAEDGDAVYVPHAGFAPGLSNILAGYLYYSEGSRDIEILVGGLQEEPMPPMGYRPTFNAGSVIDEYTRPARFLRGGKVETAEPLETVEGMEMEGLGKLETFYSDGLATLLDTLTDATVIEKTLRYPGHLEKMRFLRDMGYFSSDPVGNCSPREISDGIFRNLGGDFRDLSILEVKSLDASGTSFSCIDHYDESTGTTSMGRMTGYSAAAVAKAVHAGMAGSPGVFATEWIGRDRKFFSFILDDLATHGIEIIRK